MKVSPALDKFLLIVTGLSCAAIFVGMNYLFSFIGTNIMEVSVFLVMCQSFWENRELRRRLKDIEQQIQVLTETKNR